MRVVKKPAPVPPPTTYDLLDLTEEEVQVLIALTGGVVTGGNLQQIANRLYYQMKDQTGSQIYRLDTATGIMKR